MRFVNEALAEERPHLRPLPLAPFKSVLKLERRVSREGMISVGGNTYTFRMPREAEWLRYIPSPTRSASSRTAR